MTQAFVYMIFVSLSLTEGAAELFRHMLTTGCVQRQVTDSKKEKREGFWAMISESSEAKRKKFE
jgi:hypothetical protein